MKESIDDFMSRIYVNFLAERVLVWNGSKKIGKCQRWSLEQLKQYVNYLQQEEVIV